MSKKQKPNLDHIRHSLAHLLAAAVLELYPDTKLGIGPTIEYGFYYDFKFSKKFTEDDLPKLEELMRGYIQDGLLFSGKKITSAEARKIFKTQPFKLDLIKEFINEKAQLTAYATGTIFRDLCRGGHINSTEEIDPRAFKLTHLAGAYWRGDENNDQLTRIYGLAFHTKQELNDHLAMLEEAKKRDHKKLGRELDLFTFSELVGSGLPLWTPKGTILRNLLDVFVWELRKQHGYERVEIPHIAKKELYEASGHWKKFSEELFKIKTREGHEFAMKPMNCPHHTQIFARRQWSYREMPQRYANTTMCYRDEQSGELSGISRARSFTQDDAHVFCRKDQIKREVLNIWDIVDEFYKACGFPLEVHLSLHDPKELKRYLGSPAIWTEAERAMKQLAKERGIKPIIDIGEAAFYGPKIDFIAKDALGRSWQVATIQLDMNQPKRFGLTYINEQGKQEQVFMIHAAIMGSIERFLSVFIEHTAGKFPVWVAPVQVAILPISEQFELYAHEVHKTLVKHDIRVEEKLATETLGKRIRGAELERIPYILVVGEKEQKVGSVNVRHYKDGTLGEQSISSFLKKIQEEISRRT
ncbi:MAG: threonine--tRNA ligase [Candidatus Harrisonbacteria bacterium CG10_big_fil_rev_8_21_14_0_10_42_17]|uniref:Threonine--tRNA ligase n=1 Tax=Candidatus Harrisonbacteria bacterium CG10_big_fil_rev_8_21_14_0_10_42_17 TaxID=1974584 RepID=A0A2M6WH27_9BACT|nr:MAG: threonine--tRNA ligase [Candidatus Harrisonbacteria bacterium CG10_big_fil_rev_8_21_14_0_10_42_17]